MDARARRSHLVTTALAATLAGCGGAPATTPIVPQVAPSVTTRAASVNPIEHIVIVIQENRSFDNLFHGFTEPSGAKADDSQYGLDRKGNKIALQSVPFEEYFDTGHSHTAFNAMYDGGKNDGWFDYNQGMGANLVNYGYAYLPQAEVQPYWDMATQGALAERFFHGVTGPTYPSHLMFVAGTTNRVIGGPNVQLGWGCEDPMAGDKTGYLFPDNTEADNQFPCFDGLTIAELLERTHHTWHYYSGQVGVTPGGNLNGLASYRQIFYGPSWSANAIAPETRILTDVPAGTLADVTYVVPEAPNSDHAQGGISTGPQWVASVVNAIGQSSFWNSTAIFVTWDDWGGWYDHVTPQPRDAMGPGYRIPLILISPYAKHGKLIDTTYEPGSILRFTEETFGLGSLGATDVTSNSVADMFDFTQTPAPFKTIAAKLGRRYFLERPISYAKVDD